MDPDKAILNIILYEKRFTTYIFCAVMFIIGLGLSFIKVPDQKVLDEYNKTYPTISITENLEGISIEKKDKDYFLSNNQDKKIIGIYIDKNYQKGEFPKGKSTKITIPCEGQITSCVINE